MQTPVNTDKHSLQRLMQALGHSAHETLPSKVRKAAQRA